jgi:myo-inositol-1(or 4)-monophosphatase
MGCVGKKRDKERSGRKKMKDALKDVMIKAATDAGAAVMELYHKRHVIHEKPHEEYFTEADKKSEKIIKDIIALHYPDHNVISEESGRENRGSNYTWFIDPIDGTHNYMRGMPYFAINIAVMKDKDIIMGVMNFPALNIFLFAEKGKGCFLNDKKVSVSSRELKDSIFLTTTHLKNVPEFKSQINNIVDKVFSIRVIGCAAMDTMLVASGSCEFYLCHNVKPWDIAPGIVAVLEAGGKITGLKGEQADVWMSDILFSNKKTHDEILRCI